MIGVATQAAAVSGSLPSVVKAGSAARRTLRVGWVLKEMVAQGDCGIDAMAFNAGMPHNAATWKAIRAELADFMLEVAHRVTWQDSFKACHDSSEK